MGFIALFILAVGVSMDAFAVAVCVGLTLQKNNLRKAAVVGLYFGAFQAAMPLIGYLIAALFAERVTAFGHWLAFALLCLLGAKMIVGGLKQDDCPEEEARLTPLVMLPLALATSIDALAVGVSFAFLQVRIVPAVAFIGVTTFLCSMLGVKIGGVFGARFKSKAEIAGGVILVLMGVRIVVGTL